VRSYKQEVTSLGEKMHSIPFINHERKRWTSLRTLPLRKARRSSIDLSGDHCTWTLNEVQAQPNIYCRKIED
jgi:hypothetical protein